MHISRLRMYKRGLGLTRYRNLKSLLMKFSSVFHVQEVGYRSSIFRLTPEAERLYYEELKLKNEMEDLSIIKLRKLLMMSLEKRILLRSICHLQPDFGLPPKFFDTICHRYPEYFKVVPNEHGPALELTHWDPELAIPAAENYAEENRLWQIEERNFIIDRPLKFDTVLLPKGRLVSKSDMFKLVRFKNMPYISPYSDFSALGRASAKKEKHACGVVHEILSLTLEKRTLVEVFTHLRDEFKFSQQIRGMLLRHPDMFYVSCKGPKDSVFLREAYRGRELRHMDRLLPIKQKLKALIAEKSRAEYPNLEEDDESDLAVREDCSVGYRDDSGDEDDSDLPPDFSEDEASTWESGKYSDEVNGGLRHNEEAFIPSFSDGYQRERW